MDNLEIYNKGRIVPTEAQKEIQAGKLKGFTDVNPMYRIQRMTEIFGPCGIGWYYVVTDKWITEGEGIERVCNVQISLFIKVGNEWSMPIVGVGGSRFTTATKNGADTSDECVDGDCEVLTKKGWVKFKDYNGIDEVAQFDKNTSAITFVKPVNFITKWSLDTYKKGDIIMTGGHRNLVEKPSGKRDTVLAEELANYKGRGFRDICAGFYGKRVSLTPLQRVGIMICCDGTLFQELKDGSIVWQISVSKERKIERIKQLLNDAGIEISKHFTGKRDNEKWDDYTTFRFKLDDGVNYKKYSEFLPFANYEGLLEEAIFWDGNFTGLTDTNVQSFFSTDYDNIRYLQTLLALSGEETTIYGKRRENVAHKVCYTLYKHKQRIRMRPICRYGEGCQVYCIEVPSTYFLLRKGDFIHITGNCYKMALTDAISVATKSLGIAADIYWQQGANYGTKYDLPDAGKQKDLDDVLKEIKGAKDVEALKALVNTFRATFGKDTRFVAAVNERNTELTK